ncbi:MAG: alpha/beta hydrolase [Proteobacteria bacterium]|nr:alpha/beta hydrolase [Pseudomonadota bacterium]
MLAHGGGQTRHSWASTSARLAEAGWQCVCMDLRGHGESGWHSGGAYSIEDFGRDLIAVGGQMPVKPHVVGASLGGLAGLVAEASLAPNSFLSLTLVDIVPRSDPQGVAKITGFMSAHAEEGFASLEEASDAIAAYLPHRKRPTDLGGLRKNLRLDADGRYRWHWDPAFTAGVRRSPLQGDMDAFESLVASIQLPVHLIRGRLSELVSAEAAAAFISKLANGRLTDVADAAHMVAGDRNDVFAKAVLDFLEGMPS